MSGTARHRWLDRTRCSPRGGRDGKAAQLPVDYGWLELHGPLYRPHAEVLEGTLTFPEAQPPSPLGHVAPLGKESAGTINKAASFHGKV